MNRRQYSACVVLLCVAGATIVDADESQVSDSMQKWVGEVASAWELPSLGVCIVTKSRAPIFARGGHGTIPDEATVVPIGSLTKSFTATLAVLLAREGGGALSDPCELPRTPPLREGSETQPYVPTLRELLSHTAGISELDLAWRSEGRTREELVAFSERFLRASRRGRFEYSNVGYALAGSVIERLGGKPWETALRERILVPLGLSCTDPSPPAASHAGTALDGYRLKGGTFVPAGLRECHAVAPALGMNSTFGDLLKWLHVCALGPDTAENGQGEISSAVRETMKPVIFLESAEGDSPLPLAWHGYGLGWEAGGYEGVDVAYHSGAVPGFSTAIMILPAGHIGVLACTNLEGSRAPLAVCFAVLDKLAGRPLTKYYSTTLTLEKEARLRDARRDCAEATLVKHPILAADEARVSGHFEADSWGFVRVVRENGRLAIEYEGRLLAELEHSSRTAYRLTRGPLGDEGYVVFHFSAMGTPSHLTIELRGRSDLYFYKTARSILADLRVGSRK